jgi:NAD(P)-dependent dehydrogenase (short-subunit alcohol dehydrogenase family)
MARTAIVTGGTGGLGSAVVRRFLDDGWRVVVPWVAERELERVPTDDRLALIEADLCDPDSVAEVVALGAADADAPLHAAVNLVGGFAEGGRVHETPIEDFEAQFRLNLRPTYLVSAAVIPHLLEAGDGAIVCVSTRAAVRPFSGAAGYISSKAAVLAFVDALAAEYRKDGIRANAILPSIIDTPGNRAANPNGTYDNWVRPEEIAAVIRFLCSDEASPTSGAHIPVYGKA